MQVWDATLPVCSLTLQVSNAVLQVSRVTFLVCWLTLQVGNVMLQVSKMGLQTRNAAFQVSAVSLRVGTMRCAADEVSKVFDQLAHTHAEGFGDAHQGVNTGGLLTPLDLAEINRMQIGFFGQFFLAHPARFAMFPDGFANYFLMRLLSRHADYVNTKPLNTTHCITFYLSACFSVRQV